MCFDCTQGFEWMQPGRDDTGESRASRQDKAQKDCRGRVQHSTAQRSTVPSRTGLDWTVLGRITRRGSTSKDGRAKVAKVVPSGTGREGEA